MSLSRPFEAIRRSNDAPADTTAASHAGQRSDAVANTCVDTVTAAGPPADSSKRKYGALGKAPEALEPRLVSASLANGPLVPSSAGMSTRKVLPPRSVTAS